MVELRPAAPQNNCSGLSRPTPSTALTRASLAESQPRLVTAHVARSRPARPARVLVTGPRYSRPAILAGHSPQRKTAASVRTRSKHGIFTRAAEKSLRYLAHVPAGGFRLAGKPRLAVYKPGMQLAPELTAPTTGLQEVARPDEETWKLELARPDEETWNLELARSGAETWDLEGLAGRCVRHALGRIFNHLSTRVRAEGAGLAQTPGSGTNGCPSPLRTGDIGGGRPREGGGRYGGVKGRIRGDPNSGAKLGGGTLRPNPGGAPYWKPESRGEA